MIESINIESLNKFLDFICVNVVDSPPKNVLRSYFFQRLSKSNREYLLSNGFKDDLKNRALSRFLLDAESFVGRLRCEEEGLKILERRGKESHLNGPPFQLGSYACPKIVFGTSLMLETLESVWESFLNSTGDRSYDHSPPEHGLSHSWKSFGYFLESLDDLDISLVTLFNETTSKL